MWDVLSLNKCNESPSTCTAQHTRPTTHCALVVFTYFSIILKLYTLNAWIFFYSECVNYEALHSKNWKKNDKLSSPCIFLTLNETEKQNTLEILLTCGNFVNQCIEIIDNTLNCRGFVLYFLFCIYGSISFERRRWSGYSSSGWDQQTSLPSRNKNILKHHHPRILDYRQYYRVLVFIEFIQLVLFL